MGDWDKFQRGTILRASLFTILRRCLLFWVPASAPARSRTPTASSREGSPSSVTRRATSTSPDFRRSVGRASAEKREVLTMVGAAGCLRRSCSRLRGGDRHDQEPRQPRPNQAQRAHGARPASERVRPRATLAVPRWPLRAIRPDAGNRMRQSPSTRNGQILPSAKELSDRERVLKDHGFGIVALAAKGEAMLREGRAREQSRGLRISGVFGP